MGYWTRIGSMLSSLNASSCSGVGLAKSVNRCVIRSGTRMVLRVSVPRCVDEAGEAHDALTVGGALGRLLGLG